MSDISSPGGRIRSFVERIEHLDTELQDLNESKKEVFSEAKAEGSIHQREVLANVLSASHRHFAKRAYPSSALSSFQELIMTEHPVHNELFNRRTTDSFASRQLSRALIAGGLLVAALIGATFVTPQSRLAHKAFVDSSGSGAVPAVEPMKIVPADVLGTGVSWSPLTGDGSN
jgi:uncharacterized protein (UPF0335 family)